MVEWDELELCITPEIEKINFDELVMCRDENDFDFSRFIGRRNLRATVNVGRIHILNHFLHESGIRELVEEHQSLIDSGKIIPRINLEEDYEAYVEKLAIIVKHIDSIYVVYCSRNRLVVELHTANQEELESVGMALHAFGINLKYEIAAQDELKTPENLLLQDMVKWVQEHKR
jgi:hypothetical protein